MDATAGVPTSDLLRELMRATPSIWAEQVRWIQPPSRPKGPYSFRGRPYLIEPHDCQGPRLVGNKGAQIGWTDLGINRGIHCILCLQGNALTVLPQSEQLETFVQARIDPALAMSPVLKSVPVSITNPRHKRIADGNWYFRGSNSLNTFVEIPGRLLILDEYDRLNLACIPLARARLMGTPADERRELMISTPTAAGRGIDAEYHSSSRGRWHVPCPHCGEARPLTWEHVALAGEDGENATWRCTACGRPWTEAEKRTAVNLGEWVHEVPDHRVRGYHLSRLYSPEDTANSIAEIYQEAKIQDNRPELMREFQNQILALPWSDTAEGLTDVDIDRARRLLPFQMRGEASPGAASVSMGVDQGPRRIHVSVSEWTDTGSAASRRRQVVALYVVSDWIDLDEIMRRHNVSSCIVDALPEQRAARDFQSRWPEHVWLAFYPEGLRELCKWRGFEASDNGPSGPFGMRGGYVEINRTEGFDRLFARFQEPPTIFLPLDLPPEARGHLKALQIAQGSDRFQNPVRKYDNGKRADHFAHAMLYDEIAGLQVGELGPAELPEDRGRSDAPRGAPWADGPGEYDEFEVMGRTITGI